MTQASYKPYFLIRFRGTLTQGPNAGLTYDYASSWGGVQFRTEAEARAKLAVYQEKEPAIEYQLIRRQFVDGLFVEDHIDYSRLAV